MHVTFISSDQPMDQAASAACHDLLTGLRLQPVSQNWLVHGQMLRYRVAADVTLEQAIAIRTSLTPRRMDMLCTPVELPTIRLMVADMDSTIVTSETLDEIAAAAGHGEEVAHITTLAMNGQIDFQEAITKRVAMLQGSPVSILQDILKETHLSPGARELVMGMKERGVRCVLVSGGFDFFTAPIARDCGFDHQHGNRLLIDGQTLAGKVAQPIVDKNAKLAFLKQHAADLGVNLSQSVAIGDGANDLPMLQAAGIGIGYRPRPVVAANLLNVLQYASLADVLHVV